jgi:pyruvate kinase
VHGENSRSFEQMLAVAEATVRREAFARAGDTVVVVAGIPFGHAGSTNNIHVARV